MCVCVCVCLCGEDQMGGVAALRSWNQGNCRGGSGPLGVCGIFGEMLTRVMGSISSLEDRFYYVGG